MAWLRMEHDRNCGLLTYAVDFLTLVTLSLQPRWLIIDREDIDFV